MIWFAYMFTIRAIDATFSAIERMLTGSGHLEL